MDSTRPMPAVVGRRAKAALPPRFRPLNPRVAAGSVERLDIGLANAHKRESSSHFRGSGQAQASYSVEKVASEMPVDGSFFVIDHDADFTPEMNRPEAMAMYSSSHERRVSQVCCHRVMQGSSLIAMLVPEGLEVAASHGQAHPVNRCDLLQDRPSEVALDCSVCQCGLVAKGASLERCLTIMACFLIQVARAPCYGSSNSSTQRFGFERQVTKAPNSDVEPS